MSFYHKKQFFDLKNISHISYTSATMRKAVAYEYWQNRFCSIDGFYPLLLVSAMRRALSWQLQGKKLFLLGSVPVHVLCYKIIHFFNNKLRLFIDTQINSTYVFSGDT